jgi:hypothetical protein
LPFASRSILGFAGVLIALGGLYDLFTPHLPDNLAAICGQSEAAQKLVRELLRALGGSLVAIGLAVCFLSATALPVANPRILTVVLLLILVSEGVNAFSMRRVGSPYHFPLAIVLLAVFGVSLAFLQSSHQLHLAR